MDKLNPLLKDDIDKKHSVKVLKFNRSSEKYINILLKNNIPRFIFGIVLLVIVIVIIILSILLAGSVVLSPIIPFLIIPGAILSCIGIFITLNSIWNFIGFNILKLLQKIESNKRHKEIYS